jgi:hypothetical protein
MHENMMHEYEKKKIDLTGMKNAKILTDSDTNWELGLRIGIKHGFRRRFLTRERGKSASQYPYRYQAGRKKNCRP